MAVVTTFPLRDGPLAGKTREEVVAAMGADLVRFDAWRNEADAIRALMWRGVYSSWEIMRELDNARQAAMQSVVAKQMSAP